MNKKGSFKSSIGLVFIFALITEMLLGISFGTYEAKAAEIIPKVGIASLDHTPFIEGDNNKFFIASKGYSGQVQYQLFYTCKTTMGNKWELINNDITVGGWTNPVNADKVVEFDISGLKLKPDYYRFAIRVKRVGVKGKYSNQYGDYDSALPFTISVIKNSPIKLNGDMVIEKEEYLSSENLVINGVNGAASNLQYKLHLYDVKRNMWLKNLTGYGSKISYSLKNIPEGTYIVDIWGKDPKSKSNYDGWKLKVINVKKDKNINVDELKLYSYHFPEDYKNLVVTDKYIFYVADSYHQIFRMNREGSKPILLSKTDRTDYFEIDGNYIYYANNSDGLKMYRMNLDGSGKKKITDEGYVEDINVTKDYIYYTCHGDMVDGRDLFRINKDGSNKVRITDVSTSYVKVYKDEIYFANSGLWEGHNLYKMNLDGSQIKKLNDDWTSEIKIVNDMIFYLNGNEAGKLYGINTDGTSRTMVKDNAGFDIYILGDYIYYRFKDGSTSRTPVPKSLSTAPVDSIVKTNLSGNILNGGFAAMRGEYIYIKDYRYKADGSEKLRVAPDYYAELNVVGDWIYYRNWNYDMYRVKTDGTQKTLISKDNGFYMNVVGNYIYYIAGQDNTTSSSARGDIVKVRTDGTGRTHLTIGKDNYNLIVVDGWIYYISVDDNHTVYRMKTDGSGKEKVLEERTGYMNIEGDYIYYFSSNDKQIKKMSLSSKEVTNLGVNSSSFIVTPEKIFYRTIFDIYSINLDGSENTLVVSNALGYHSYDYNIVGDYLYYHSSGALNKIKVK